MQNLDIIVFAIVAIVIALRLRSVLGQRAEDEPKRPNPFAPPPAGGKDEDDVGFLISPKQEAEQLQGLAPSPMAPVLAPESLAGGIALIRQLDVNFEEKAFLGGARAAFAMIVGAYARGDLALLKKYLGPVVYDAFAQAIATREAAGQKLETNILAIKEAELTQARLTGDVARVTVRFVSEQTNITTNSDGSIAEGSADRREEIEDVWSFARNLKESDPNWLLVETRI
jgi:predicted lipid-binding transport protein (Tim44 family)